MLLYMFWRGRQWRIERPTPRRARISPASATRWPVADTREPYIIERRNGENVALISEAELSSLLETAHLLRSPRNAQRLASALERARGGQLAPETMRDLRKSLGLDKTKG